MTSLGVEIYQDIKVVTHIALYYTFDELKERETCMGVECGYLEMMFV